MQANDELVAQCLQRWDSGGREDLHEAVSRSLASAASSGHADVTQPTPEFMPLWRALLLSHVQEPKLNISAFQALIHTMSPQQEDHVPSSPRAASDAEGPSHDSSVVAGPSRLSVAPGSPAAEAASMLPNALAQALLDVIWAVDLEIELRRETAEAAGCSGIDLKETSEQKGKGKGKDQPFEEFKAARARLADLVRELLNSRHLSRLAVSERLDVPLLAAVGLVTDEAMFNKKGVRINTTNLYKQQKFNLLREENEGYSGLINELLGGMGPEISALYTIPFNETHNWQTAPAQIVEQESPQDRNKRARSVMRNISALIGYFDLDPNRVLDIILDIFASNVVLHWPFFVALLAASPWSRGKSSGCKHTGASNAMEVDGEDDASPIAGIKIDADGGTGNPTCAQLLGFKFDYYRLPDTREDVPNELYLMSALLIQNGFVRFADLWPHLSPDEDGMKAMQKKYTAALKDKAASAGGNALTMAAPLADDEGDNASGTANSKESKDAGLATLPAKEAPNQVVGLLKALLSMGEVSYSLFILGLHPWLIGAFPDAASLYIRLLKEVLWPAYEAVSCAQLEPVLGEEFLAAPRMRFDVRRQALLPAPAPRLIPTSTAPEPPATSHARFIFAFGETWKKNLPRCETEADVSNVFMPLLRLLGVHLHRDIALFQQLCRLGRAQLRSTPSSETKKAWLEVARFHLFPALALTQGNSGLLNELWNMLRTLPYTERFGLYGEWKNELYKLPEIKYRQSETEKQAKGILKRISKDNLKLSGRALAKASHANPLIFFNVALYQVQVYDNMIPHIVECAKYLTLLEYDIFSFNLIDALSNPEKERTKQDGTNISLWLKSLASFTGTLYKRYTMMDPVPVLQYITNQLKANNSKDLVIIRELILKMSGIEPLANLADKQIAALSGGRYLRMQAMMAASAGPGTTARLQIKRTGARMMDALLASKLAAALLILISQQRQVCVHLVPEQEAHLRYLGNLADSCQEVLFQYVEFLYSQLEPAAYAELVPNIKSLCTRFAIEPSIAFHIGRPRLLHAMKQADEAQAEKKLRAELIAGKAKSQTAAEAATTPSGETQDVDMQEASTEGQARTPAAASPPSAAVQDGQEPKSVWRPGLQEAVDAAEEVLPDSVKRVLSPHFYATFWQLSLADIQVPSERYDQEMRVMQQLMKEADSGDSKKNMTYLRHQDTLEQLRSELKARTLNHQATRRRLANEKDHWFADNEGSSRLNLVHQLLQHCLIPRALISPTDAIFAGKFVRLMHMSGARNFSSLTLYDRVFIEHIAPVIFSCTENEANSYARFLQVILDDLMPWFKDQKLFEKEVVGNNLPGFQLRWGDRRGGEEIPKEAMCTYEQFRNVLLKWHDMMLGAFKQCLTSRDFMRIRNAIVVMNRISQNFPLFDAHGRTLTTVVEKLTAEETRGSLRVLGQGLLATLKKRAPEWLGKERKDVAAAKSQQARDTKPQPAKDSSQTSRQVQASKVANANAAETKKPDSSSNGSAAPAATKPGKPAEAPQIPASQPARASEQPPVAGPKSTTRASDSPTDAPSEKKDTDTSAASPPPNLPTGPKRQQQTDVPQGPSAERSRPGNAQAVPKGPAGAQRKGSASAMSPPLDSRRVPSQSGANPNLPAGPGQQQAQSPRVEASMPSRPALSRPTSTSMLPARPGRERDNGYPDRSIDRNNDRNTDRSSDRKVTAQAPQAPPAKAEQTSERPPTRPRGDIRDTREARAPRDAREAKDARAREPRELFTAENGKASAARQAALDTMNPPQSPASMGGAHNSRTRAAAAPSDRNERPASGAVNSRASSPARASRTGSGPSSRDPSPRNGRGGGDDSSRSRGRERDDRDGRSDRDHRDRRDKEPRSAKDNREREREDRRRGGAPSTPTEPRRAVADRYSGADRERERERDRDRDRDGRRYRDSREGSSTPRRDIDSSGPRRDADTNASRRDPDTNTPRRDVDSSTPRKDASGPVGPSTPAERSSVEDATAAAYKRRRVERGERPEDRPAERGSNGARGAEREPERRPAEPARDKSSSVDKAPPRDAPPRDAPRHDAPRPSLDRARRSISGISGQQVGDSPSTPNGSGLKRSLADRLSVQDGSASPSANAGPGGPAERVPDGPDQKRARINRNRFGGGNAGADEHDGAGGPQPVRHEPPRAAIAAAAAAAAASPGPPTTPAGLRSVSISGSAARERERRESERERERGASSGRGRDDRPERGDRRRRSGRRDDDRYKDRSRRRAGED